MPAYIPGYIPSSNRKPYFPAFPQECLPKTPASTRGITYLKAVLATLGGKVDLPPDAPAFTVKRRDGVERIRIKSIADAFMGFDVERADTGEKERLFTFTMNAQESARFTEDIVRRMGPDPVKVEYEYLRLINAAFVMQHGELDASDFEKIFNAQRLAMTARSTPAAHRTVFTGDTVQGAYYGGKHPFGAGIIVQKPTWAAEDDTNIHFCAEPFEPYMAANGNLDPSGGPWFSAGRNHFTFVGEEERLFWCFGHAGMCAGGGIHFPCRSNRWALDSASGI